ncbi:hypothetical protein JW905_05830 [bacterium]|nr:hypothetical protein [candidate division CSSED10-310 bacterium]
MRCPRCRKSMVEQHRSFHKHRKWVCPGCGKVIMQAVAKQRRIPPRRDDW